MSGAGGFSAALPFDIFALIIEYFAFLPNGRGLRTLSSISRTCSTLQPICQRRIFSTISLRPRICDWSFAPRGRPENEYEVPSVALAKLQRVFQGNPTLAGYVRTLYYHSHDSSYEEDGGEGLIRLLGMFTRLEKLVVFPYLDVHDFGFEEEADEDAIFDTNITALPLKWNKLPQDLRDALVKLIGTVSTFQFKNVVNFPVDIFLSCPKLRCLDISHSRLSPLSPDVSPHNLPILLEELRLVPGARNNIQVLRGLRPEGIPVFDFSHIKRISFTLDNDGDPGQLGEILEGSLLECLQISSPEWFSPKYSDTIGLNAQQLENLRELTLARSSSLEKLNVSLNANPIHHELDIFERLKELDHHLTDPVNFPVLKSVSLNVNIIPCHTQASQHWDRLPETHLSQLKRTISEFNYSVRSAWQ